jgi:hypothetical protein
VFAVAMGELASEGGGLFGEVRQWVNPRYSFFSLARCRLQLQAEKLAGGGGGAPPRTARIGAQAPVGSPTSELKAVPPRPALLPVRPSLVPSFRHSVVSIYLVSSETRQGSFWRQLS